MTAPVDQPCAAAGCHPAGMRWLHLALVAAVSVLALLHLAEAHSLWGEIGSDYVIFYDAAHRFVTAPLTLYPAEAQRTLTGYLYPPPSILLFLPLLLGSLQQSFLVTNAVVLGCALLSCGLWLRLVREQHGLGPNRLGALIILGLAMGTGAMLAVRQGQVDTVILMLCVAPVWLDNRNRPGLAGALIAAGCWIKIYPVLLLFWLWQRPQRRRMLAGFVIAAIGIPLASLAVIPAALYVDYFQHQLPAMSARAIVFIDNQSLAAIYLRTTTPLTDYVDEYTALALPTWFRGGILIAMLGGMSAIVRKVRRTGAPALLIASWATAVACLVAPLGWGHTYCLLLPLFIHTARVALDRIGAGERTALAQGIVIAACYAALLLPGHFRLRIDTAIPAWAAQVFYARYALAALVLLAVSWRQAREEGPQSPTAALSIRRSKARTVTS